MRFINIIPEILLFFAIGAAMGYFYFGGLYWTIRKSVGMKHPGRLFVASFLLRILVLGMVFFLLMNKEWGDPMVRLASFLPGFFLVRIIMIRKREFGAGRKDS